MRQDAASMWGTGVAEAEQVRILALVHELAIRRLPGRRLAGYGCSVITAGSDQGVLDLATQQLPDLIQLDVNLEGRADGLDVCLQQRKLDKTPTNDPGMRYCVVDTQASSGTEVNG